MSSQDFTLPLVIEDLTPTEDNGGVDHSYAEAGKPLEGALEVPAGPELCRSPWVGLWKTKSV